MRRIGLKIKIERLVNYVKNSFLFLKEENTIVDDVGIFFVKYVLLFFVVKRRLRN